MGGARRHNPRSRVPKKKSLHASRTRTRRRACPMLSSPLAVCRCDSTTAPGTQALRRSHLQGRAPTARGFIFRPETNLPLRPDFAAEQTSLIFLRTPLTSPRVPAAPSGRRSGVFGRPQWTRCEIEMVRRLCTVLLSVSYTHGRATRHGRTETCCPLCRLSFPPRDTLCLDTDHPFPDLVEVVVCGEEKNEPPGRRGWAAR